MSVDTVVTTAHDNEEFKDVADFFLNATYFESNNFRCIAFLDKDENSSLSKQLLVIQTNSKRRMQ